MLSEGGPMFASTESGKLDTALPAILISVNHQFPKVRGVAFPPPRRSPGQFLLAWW